MLEQKEAVYYAVNVKPITFDTDQSMLSDQQGIEVLISDETGALTLPFENSEEIFKRRVTQVDDMTPEKSEEFKRRFPDFYKKYSAKILSGQIFGPIWVTTYLVTETEVLIGDKLYTICEFENEKICPFSKVTLSNITRDTNLTPRQRWLAQMEIVTGVLLVLVTLVYGNDRIQFIPWIVPLKINLISTTLTKCLPPIQTLKR